MSGQVIVYFMQKSDGFEIVILWVGGDKLTQQQNIKIALQLAYNIKGEQWRLH